MVERTGGESGWGGRDAETLETEYGLFKWNSAV